MKKSLFILAAAFSLTANAQSGIITTVAGNGSTGLSGNGGQATAAEFNAPKDVTFDHSGNLYVVDVQNNCIRKITTSGVISMFAGTGAQGFAGDGGQATAAKLYTPGGIVFDAAGNAFIADEDNFCIRKVTTAGIITTVAGQGSVPGYTGDGGQATAATLIRPYGVAVDNAGNLYIADTQNGVIRKVNSAGIITTVVGNGTVGFSGDGGQATAAELHNPEQLAFDASGNLYIADSGNNRVRMVNSTGIISTYAGNNTTGGFSGDGGQATAASFHGPYEINFDAAGNLYIADGINNRIRMINTAGIINTVVGNGTAGFSGDGSAATAAELNSPVGVAVDAAGNIYIADFVNNRIRKTGPCSAPSVSISGNDSVCSGSSAILIANGASTYVWSSNAGSATTSSVSVSPSTNTTYTVTGSTAGCSSSATVTVFINSGSLAQIITTLAGNGSTGLSGNGGQATAAEFNAPKDVTFDASGNLYVVDVQNNCIRKITTSGVISMFAGTGAQGFSGDGGQATAAELYTPGGVVFDAAGNAFIADEDNFCIRKVTTAGIITTVAGQGSVPGYTGDGAQATAATLIRPYGVAVDNAGNLYIADTQNGVIRKVNSAGIITTVVGNGTVGFSGDGGQATAAELHNPEQLAFDAAGNLYIADSGNNRIRKVNKTTGIITTFAGNNTTGSYSGDGGQATAAGFYGPYEINFDAAGNLYIADGINNRIRMVNTAGIINTVVGNGTAGFSGDGSAATSAELNSPVGVAVDAAGNIYIADFVNNRIRKTSACGSNGTGITQTKNNVEALTIYPNPNNGSFTIESNSTTKQTIQMFDINGKIVLTQTITGKTTVDASTLSEGIYNISIISKEGVLNKRVVVVH